MPQIQPPKGTRDAYPDDYLRRRYIVESWRRVALRHGFDEIDGPTFEQAELYTIKSGQAILNEVFGVFSGKDPDQREAAAKGEAPFALRPEFTPTLARMYAARAKQLPSPCKWFTVPNFFRAERPQRGRLREFLQWNVDVIGDLDTAHSFWRSDLEVILCLSSLLDDLGVTRSVSVHLSNRYALGQLLSIAGVSDERMQDAFLLADSAAKLPDAELFRRAADMNLDYNRFVKLVRAMNEHARESQGQDLELNDEVYERGDAGHIAGDLLEFALELRRLGCANPFVDMGLARGLAYYTGTVFEVIAEGERAVAGGGRYDNLIELFGGPPTPACGFGMGDVVLTNLLEDSGLMPKGKDLLTALDQPIRTRPDAFILPSPDLDDTTANTLITQTLATLRRGTLAEGNREPWHPNRYTHPPLHARRSYKTTRKLQKLLAEASEAHARFAIILESDSLTTIKDLDTGAQTPNIALADLPAALAAQNAR